MATRGRASPVTPAAMSSPPQDVSLSDVLRVCEEIHREFVERQPDRGPVVVPVLLDEIERWDSLLEAVFSAAGGVVIRADICGDGVDPGGTAVPTDLIGAIESMLHDLTDVDPASYTGLHVVQSADNVCVQGPARLSAASRAAQGIRKLLSALFHPDLRSSDLAVLTWDEGSFDAPTSHLVFDLVRRLPELLELQRRATLVLVIGNTDLRPGEHGSLSRGIRYRVTGGDGLQRRGSEPNTRERVREWSRLTPSDTPLAVLMLGAGCSAAAGLPMGNALRDRALSRRVDFEVDQSTVETAAHQVFEQLSDAGRLTPDERADGVDSFARTLTLERLIREEQHEEHRKLSWTLRQFRELHDSVMATLDTRFPATSDPFRSLVTEGRQLVLVTVNFDQVLEKRGQGLIRSFATEAEISSFGSYLEEYRDRGGLVPILKLHGDIGAEETLVANTDETTGGLSRSRLEALRAVREALRPSGPWWYVGYSMRDRDLNPIFAGPDFADGVAERWVLPILDKSVRNFIDEHRLRRWQREGSAYTADERVVTVTAEDFWRLLSDAGPV